MKVFSLFGSTPCRDAALLSTARMVHFRRLVSIGEGLSLLPLPAALGSIAFAAPPTIVPVFRSNFAKPAFWAKGLPSKVCA